MILWFGLALDLGMIGIVGLIFRPQVRVLRGLMWVSFGMFALH